MKTAWKDIKAILKIRWSSSLQQATTPNSHTKSTNKGKLNITFYVYV